MQVAKSPDSRTLCLVTTNPSEKANGYLSLPFLDLSRELKSNIQMKKGKNQNTEY